MKGIYQHCAEKRLHRYLGKFDGRYNTCDLDDHARTDRVPPRGVGAVGKWPVDLLPLTSGGVAKVHKSLDLRRLIRALIERDGGVR